MMKQKIHKTSRRIESHCDTANLRKNPDEKKDCVVRAFSAAANIPYAESYEIMKVFAKRRKNCGVRHSVYCEVLEAWSFEQLSLPYRINRRFYTLNMFLEDFPKGRYFVRKLGHAFAVIDGKLYDNSYMGKNTRINHIWHFKG